MEDPISHPFQREYVSDVVVGANHGPVIGAIRLTLRRDLPFHRLYFYQEITTDAASVTGLSYRLLGQLEFFNALKLVAVVPANLASDPGGLLTGSATPVGGGDAGSLVGLVGGTIGTILSNDTLSVTLGARFTTGQFDTVVLTPHHFKCLADEIRYSMIGAKCDGVSHVTGFRAFLHVRSSNQ